MQTNEFKTITSATTGDLVAKSNLLQPTLGWRGRRHKRVKYPFKIIGVASEAGLAENVSRSAAKIGEME